MPFPKYSRHVPHRFLRRIKDFSLPIAIVVGIVFWRWLAPLKPLMPYLIGAMLFFTYLKLSPRGIRPTKAHLVIGVSQIVLSVVSYALLLQIPSMDPLLKAEAAQGALVCFLAPAATASAVIIAILGGSIASGATYCLLSNVAVAFIAPLLFTYIGGAESNVPFIVSVLHIFTGVAPLIFLPLVCAWGIRYTSPKLHLRLSSLPQAAFWIWVASLAIVLAYTVKFVVDRDCSAAELSVLSLCGLIACVLQFVLGKSIGRKLENDSITTGQSFGQKNTTLAIWMAQTYLLPLSSIAPASYIIWQNSINSFQIWLKGHRERRELKRTNERPSNEKNKK